MSLEDTTYDPTALQLDAVGRLTDGELELEELCNPTAVRLLMEERLVNLVQLKSYEKLLLELRRENSNLIDSRNELRVDVARGSERDVVSWIEIPVSALLGFATSMVLDEATRSIGVVLVVMAAVILLFLRTSYMLAAAGRVGRKERDNAED